MRMVKRGTMVLALSWFASLAQAAGVYPTPEQIDHFEENYKIERSFWDLSLPAQLSSKHMESFYLMKMRISGTEMAAPGKISREDLSFIENYFAERLEQEVNDPASKLYRQFIVEKVIEKGGKSFGILAQRPLLYFRPNPALPLAEKSPFALWLDLWTQQFGPQFKIVLDHDSLFLRGFGGGWAGDLPAGGTMYLGDRMLGMSLDATSFEEILHGELLMHEYFHAYHDALFLKGQSSYVGSRISLVNEAAAKNIYQGSFVLHEIPAYLISIRNALWQIQDMVNNADLAAEGVAARIQFLQGKVTSYLKGVQEFYNLALAVQTKVLQDLATFQQSLATQKYVVYPLLPGRDGVFLRVSLQQAGRAATEEFLYTVPLTVFRSIINPPDATTSVEERMAAELSFTDLSNKHTLEEMINHQKRFQTPAAVAEVRDFVQQQTTYLREIKSIVEEVVQQWQGQAPALDSCLAQTGETSKLHLGRMLSLLETVASPFVTDDPVRPSLFSVLERPAQRWRCASALARLAQMANL